MEITQIKTVVFLLLVNFGNSYAQGFTSSKDYELYNLTEEIQGEDPSSENKHHIFATCQAFSLEPGEYVIFSNGTAYVEAYNKTYNSSFYVLTGDILTVCVPDTEIEEQLNKNGGNVRYHEVFSYVTKIGLGISIACLSMHIIVFCIVPDLRNLPGYNMVSLCISLLLSYVSFLVSSNEAVQKSGVPCIVLAAATHFLLLSSFMWMVIMAFDVFRSLLKATGQFRLATRRFIVRRFLVYCLLAWGTSLVFVATAVMMDNLDGVSEAYRPFLGQDICWFRGRRALLLLFGAPVFAITAANILLFVASAYIIYSNRMKTEQLAYRTMLRKNFTMYYRLATIMGLTWVVGFANSTNTFWLLYIYTLLSCLQGLFIFLACTCTAKVRNHFFNKFCSRRRKISSQSTTPTFQSYWNEECIATPNIYTISGSHSMTKLNV